MHELLGLELLAQTVLIDIGSVRAVPDKHAPSEGVAGAFSRFKSSAPEHRP